MPSTSNFSVALVDAVTQEQLSEYTASDGSTWVKGEPGDEFFVSVQTEVSNFSVVCCIEVDGKDIGYTWVTHKADISPPLGPLKGGQSLSTSAKDIVTHAFRFVELEANRTESNEADDDRVVPPGNGEVTAIWYTARETGLLNSDLKIGEWTGDRLEGDRLTDNKKDCSVLRSMNGSMPGSVPGVSPRTYEKDEEIGRLSLKYTTDFGMAVRGLYPKQPVQYARPKKRTERDADVVEEVARPATRVKDEKVVPKPEYKVVRSGGVEVIELDD